MRAVCLSWVVVPALVAWVSPAWADDLTLSWRAPAGCPSGEQVKARALEGTAKASKIDALAADAKVESSASDRWQVTLTTKRAGVTSDARKLEARSCAALADATAVILAMAMIPPGASNEAAPAAASTPASAAASADAPEAAPAPADGSAAAPEAAPAPAAEAAPAPAAAPADPDSVSPSLPSAPHALALGGGLTSDASTLPSAAVGGAASFAWTPGRARVEAAASFFASQSKTTGISAAGAALSLFVVGARGCYAIVKAAAFELSPCGGVDFSFVGASGFGAAANYDASARWASATAGLLVRVPVTSYFAVRAQVDGNVPFSRPTFVVDGEGDVHRPSAVGARGGIGLELDFL